MASGDDADHIEFFVKMNRMAPPSDPKPHSLVKFRPVFYDPNLEDEKLSRTEAESDESDFEVEPSGQQPKSFMFFKDPMRPPSGDRSEDKQESDDGMQTTSKLGRNMRASSMNFNNRQMDVHELMNARKKLLEQQREQAVLLNKESNAKQAAAILVNDLLLKGFHIKAPGTSPCSQTPPLQNNLSSEDTCQVLTLDEMLIQGIQQELKKVQSYNS